MLSMSGWVLSRYSEILPQSKDMQLNHGISFTGDSKLAIGVNVSANEFLYPASRSVTAGRCSMNWIEQKKNGWMVFKLTSKPNSSPSAELFASSCCASSILKASAAVNLATPFHDLV